MATIVLKNVRLAFPTLWTPERVNDEGEPAFSATFILPPDHPDVAAVRRTIKEVAAAKWPRDWEQTLKGLAAQEKICLRDGNNKPAYDGFEGNLYVSARNTARPLVIDRDKSALTMNDGRPYAGCMVNAQIDIWAQSNKWGKRVNATLLIVQFAADAPAFGSGARPKLDDMPSLDSADVDWGANDEETASLI